MPEEKGQLGFPIEWSFPDDLVARYATNMIVQRAENEFVISFFEIKPPVLLGSPDEIVEQAKNIKSVRANCVAQIIVAEGKMASFIEALQRNFNRTQEEGDNKEDSQ